MIMQAEIVKIYNETEQPFFVKIYQVHYMKNMYGLIEPKKSMKWEVDNATGINIHLRVDSNSYKIATTNPKDKKLTISPESIAAAFNKADNNQLFRLKYSFARGQNIIGKIVTHTKEQEPVKFPDSYYLIPAGLMTAGFSWFTPHKAGKKSFITNRTILGIRENIEEEKPAWKKGFKPTEKELEEFFQNK